METRNLFHLGVDLRVRPIIKITVVCVLLALASCESDDNPCTPPPKTNNPVIVFETSLGEFATVLYPDDAPVTVDNFLRYVNEGFYDSLIFHRVIRNFVIQGGAYSDSLQKKSGYDPIPNEADNGLSNVRGTIAMARNANPHSATSQFFINHKDNPFLDHRDDTPAGWGYCVFGKVIVGMNVVDAIANVETTARDGMKDVPVDPVVIIKLNVGN